MLACQMLAVRTRGENYFAILSDFLEEEEEEEEEETELTLSRNFPATWIVTVQWGNIALEKHISPKKF